MLLIWGFFVVADSPQFSALAAVYCPPEYTGTAFTIQNGIGFGITVISLQVIPWIAQSIGWQWALIFLAPGPLAGAYTMIRLKKA
jgi:nitrate/nitrite transporter NarK